MRHITYARERAILVRMLIDFHRSVARDYPQIGDWTTLQIGMFIFYHAVEGHRPPTASKLAREVGVPRPTVVRHLQRLVRLGALRREGTGYSTPEEVINTPDAERGAFNRIKTARGERVVRNWTPKEPELWTANAAFCIANGQQDHAEGPGSHWGCVSSVCSP